MMIVVLKLLNCSEPLCAIFVSSVSRLLFFLSAINHRDTEHTEVAQRSVESACECGRVDPQQRHDVFAFDALTNYTNCVVVRFVRKVRNVDQDWFQALK